MLPKSCKLTDNYALKGLLGQAIRYPLHQLNSKNNSSVLLFNAICFIFFFSKLYRRILGVGEGTE